MAPEAPKEKPAQEPLPPDAPVKPASPEIIPAPEKGKPSPPPPETEPLRVPEIKPSGSSTCAFVFG